MMLADAKVVFNSADVFQSDLDATAYQPSNCFLTMWRSPLGTLLSTNLIRVLWAIILTHRFYNAPNLGAREICVAGTQPRVALPPHRILRSYGDAAAN